MASDISTLQVVLMGLVTVFVVAPAAAPAPAADKQKTVAAIAVAIAEHMGTDVSHIRIHSIRRI